MPTVLRAPTTVNCDPRVVYATRVRGVLALVLLVACSFDHGVVPTPDGPPPDGPPDTVMPTWAVDPTSGKGVPAHRNDWAALAQAYQLATMPPEHLWLLQESSGSLQDSIGSVTLAPQNSPRYRNAVAGWSRLAVGTMDTDANQGFVTTSTGNLDGTPYLLLVYVAVASQPSAQRSLFGVGAGTDHRYVAITPARVFEGTGAGVTPTTGAADPMTSVHPVVMKLDPLQASYVIYTDQERLSVTWTGTGGLGGLLMIGNAIIGAANANYLYATLWTGPSAQMTDANVKKLLQSLGWTVNGY